MSERVTRGRLHLCICYLFILALHTRQQPGEESSLFIFQRQWIVMFYLLE